MTLKSYLKGTDMDDKMTDVRYGFVVPLHAGGYAWLTPVYQDTLILKNKECWNKDGRDRNTLYKYLKEIKSGEGNCIINPINDNSDLKWSELDYKNAKIIKRVTETIVVSLETIPV
jgi:hypothetical protein